MENVITREEFPLEKAREILKDETIAVLGYGVQGPGQACNLRDNGFNVIVGQRPGKTYDKAVADGWVPGETLFSIEEAAEKGTIVCMLLSDAAQIAVWPKIKQYLTPGKALYFSHGFGITYKERTNPRRPRTELFLRRLSGRYGPGYRPYAGFRHRHRFGLSVRDDFQARGLLRPYRRARLADGRHPRPAAGPV